MQRDEMNGEYAMVLRVDGLPVDLVCEIFAGLDRAARRTGYTAVFKETTGCRCPVAQCEVWRYRWVSTGWPRPARAAA